MAFPWYTDLFIDASATGTGSGDTPANACLRVGNNSAFTNTGSVMFRAWVRRSHVETLSAGDQVGAQFTDVNKNNKHWVIGWPSSGDPMFDERPAAGVSAGWDADNSGRSIFTNYGLNFPTFVCSLANGVNLPHVRNGTILVNFCFDQIASGAWSQPCVGPFDQSGYMDNVCFTYSGMATTAITLQSQVSNRVGRLWMVTTGSAWGGSINSLSIDEIMIHSKSICTSGFWNNQNGGPFFIGQLINYSNSVDFMFGAWNRANVAKGSMIHGYVGRVAGVKPYSGSLGRVGPAFQNGTWNGLIRIEDWYGEGPVELFGVFGPHTRLCTSAEMMYASNRVTISECNSWGNGWPQYGDANDIMRPVRKLFTCISGSTVTIFAPVYVDSTGVFSLANGTAIAWLRCIGGRGVHITGSHTLVGTLANWSGSKKGGGTAYTIATTFTPQEAGTFMYEISLPSAIMSADMGTNAYVCYGEPWMV